jgi:GNAT superfamily N-acetyltransferase
LLIREATEADLPFLKEMLYAAALWDPDGEQIPIDIALAFPQLAIYHEGWGRPGDAGLIAEEDGVPVGAVYYRLFTQAVHGHGYVDDETPELAIGVLDGHRSKGVGRALMEAIHERARRDGIRRMALSVDPRNPAKRLYASLGYEDFHPDDGHQRMILGLV